MLVHLSRIASNNLGLTNNTTSQYGSNLELQNGKLRTGTECEMFVSHLNNRTAVARHFQAACRNSVNPTACLPSGSYFSTIFCHCSGRFLMKNLAAFRMWFFCFSVHLLHLVWRASSRIAVQTEGSCQCLILC